MKTALLFIFINLGFLGFSQSLQNRQSILQQCLDSPELQKYLEPVKIEGVDVLVILDDGVLPTNVKLNKFGKPVKFMRKEELFFSNIRSFLDFNSFELSETEAQLVFQYDYKGISGFMAFEKKNEAWEIKSRELIEK